MYRFTGSKLLAHDIRIATRLMWELANGRTLSWRESRMLRRTTPTFSVVPFVIIVIVPFMEFTLPVLLKLFPNMLPSTFEDKHKKRSLKKSCVCVWRWLSSCRRHCRKWLPLRPARIWRRSSSSCCACVLCDLLLSFRNPCVFLLVFFRVIL